MNDIKDDLITLERERYKFQEEFEKFKKTLATLEEWQKEAENDPVMRKRLQQFDELYGPHYETDIETVTLKLSEVEFCCKELLRIQEAENKTRRPTGLPDKKSKEAEKPAISIKPNRNYI